MSSGLHLAVALAAAPPARESVLGAAVQRMVAVGIDVVRKRPQSTGLGRLNADAVLVLNSLARLLREPEFGDLHGGAVLAVQVARADGAASVSEQSLDFAQELAVTAPPGRVVVSLRLGQMLSLAHPKFGACLRPLRVKATNLADRDVLWVDSSADTGSEAGALEQSLRALDESARSRLAERLAGRLVEDLGPIAPLLLADVCRDSTTIDELLARLGTYLPAERLPRVRELVTTELGGLPPRG